MKKIRTIVVDDEPLARARIIHLLNEYEDVLIIGEGRNGREASRLIEDYKPDLAFLDIQMPDFTGFEAIARVKQESMPFIIFVTAFDQYALQAFDVKAVDYLLKPFDNERFKKALEHARKQLQLRDNAILHQRMIQLLQEYRYQQTGELTAFEIKDKGKTHLINVNDVQWLEAQGNYVQLHLARQSWLLRETLQHLEDQLDKTLFLRIHRSLLLNIHYIQKVKYEGNNQYIFYMKNEKKLLSSRSYKDAIVKYLEEEETKRSLE